MTRREEPIFAPPASAEIDEELGHHLEMRIAELTAQGMSREAARAAVLRRFGNVDTTRAECLRIAHRRRRNMARADYLGELRQDLRFAARSLLVQPAFTASVLVTLALGVAASASVYSVLDATVLNPLPYASAERLVHLYQAERADGDPGVPLSPKALVGWTGSQRAFSGVAGVLAERPAVTGIGEPRSVDAAAAGHALAAVLGVQPIAGRWYGESEDRAGGPAVAVLSESLWRELFAGDPAVIGRSIQIDGTATTIIGVMPARFDYPSGARLWQPLMPKIADMLDVEGAHIITTIARPKDGVDLPSAQQEVERLSAVQPVGYADLTGQVQSVVEEAAGPSRTRMTTLMLAVLVLLAIACANVAGLLLARGSVRDHEMRLRAALGAGRGRLVRQLTTEHLLLSVCGTAAGVLIAVAAVPLAVRLGADTLPHHESIAINTRVLAFALLLSVVTALVFGLAPTLQLSRPAAASGTRFTATRRTAWTRQLLVGGQLALSLILLATAGAFFRSFTRLTSIDPGFSTDVTTLRMALPGYRYETGESRTRFWRELTAALEALPGVTATGGNSNPPVSGTNMRGPVVLEGQTDPETFVPAQIGAATPGYFATLGTSVRHGRDFTWSDDLDAPPVAVVNEAFVRRHFPDGRALGRNVRSMFGPPVWREIVGVVADVRHAGPAADPPLQVFLPQLQHPTSGFTYVIRSTRPVTELVPQIRSAVQGVDPDQPIDRIATMAQLLGRTVALPRFLTLLVALFAGLALLIAAIGVYSVMAYVVAQRTTELGVRAALGASPADLRALVLRRAAAIAAAGGAVGLVGAAAVQAMIRSQLFRAPPFDATSLLAAGAALGIAAVAASFGPAARAGRVQPLRALRTE